MSTECWVHFLGERRVDEMQQELQVAMDELSQAGDQARELHPT